MMDDLVSSELRQYPSGY